MADISTLDDKGEPPAVDALSFDVCFGVAECLAGGGVYVSAEAYYTFLSAVFCRDARLLAGESYTELFRPQLDERAEEAFNDYLALSPVHTQFLRLGIPTSVRMTWSFAGMVAKDRCDGRFEKGSVLGWCSQCGMVHGHEAGVCGTVLCQIIPPMHPPVMALHEDFHRGVFKMVKG